MKHRPIFPLLNCFAVVFTVVASIIVSSCNSKEDEPKEDNYLASESVAITSFSLSPDLRVMKNLDSVFFSIDLEHGVVFNADSLPKGTNITKLIPRIAYPSSVTSAIIEMKGGTHREGTVNYHRNANDTIDFTGNVTLTLATADNEIQKTYTLKVNVHREDPDTVYWNNTASIDFPSRLGNPADQKTVNTVNEVISLILESDGTLSLAKTSDIFNGSWRVNSLNPGFVPEIRSLTAAADGTLYLRSEEGTLYASQDGDSWTAVASGWQQIIGMYGDTLLGTTLKDGKLSMVSYPENPAYEIMMPADFPLYGYSAPIEFTNRWTPQPTIVLFGGYPYSADGKSPSWAFDGTQWVNIAENALPALSGLSVMPYYSYLNSATNGLLKEFEVYLAFGGRDHNGKNSDTVYVSYDHGINWQRAQSYMQLPEGLNAGYEVDALSIGTTKESNLSNRWKLAARRKIDFNISGDVISWTCPYMFLLGGFDPDMQMYRKIRSGVLQRLTFAPLF